MRWTLLPALAVIAASCAAPAQIGSVRFATTPPVWQVNDRQNVQTTPANHPFPEKLYFFDAVLHRRLTHAMEVHAARRAMDINSLGEVPTSTWFTNRIGVRDVSLAEIARGPNVDNGPDLSEPLQVKGSKVGGGSVGIIVEDARGVRYILKFDEPHVPVMETATDVAVARLLWACGFNVPENDIVYLTRDELVLADDATVKDVFGNKSPMTVADLDASLAKIYRAPDGTYRALASKYLSGVPIGGFVQEGVREDDPNDLIPHEHRRELRGLYVFFSWLQQTDAKEDNTLDMWVTDRADPNRHYVKHYLVDFGKSFGTSAYIIKRPGDGHVENLDWEFIAKSLVAFGLWRRPFEGTPYYGIPGVGMFDVQHFSPDRWKAHAPYMPFNYKDAQDMFWASKVIMKFSRDQIRTAVEQGKFEDPRAIDYLTDILVARQRKAARHWFSQVAPLDNFMTAEQGTTLCFDDLLLKYDLVPGAAAITTYTASAYDYDGKYLGARVQATGISNDNGRACLSGLEVGTGQDDYTILRIDTQRGLTTHAPVEIHLARTSASGGLDIIGINRR